MPEVNAQLLCRGREKFAVPDEANLHFLVYFCFLPEKFLCDGNQRIYMSARSAPRKHYSKSHNTLFYVMRHLWSAFAPAVNLVHISLTPQLPQILEVLR